MHLHALQLLVSSSRLLAHALPTPGSVNSANSVNSKTTGIKNRVSDTHNVIKLNLYDPAILLLVYALIS